MDNHEIALINKVMEGDSASFDKLAKKYYSFCLRKAQRIVKDKETAKDLVQNALVQAYFCISNLKDKSAFRYWLGGIVTNVCKSYLRDHCRDSQSLEAYQRTLKDVTPTSMDKKIIHILLNAIEKLDKKYAAIIHAFYYEKKSLNAIASEFSITINTVKVRLHRARNELKNVLETNGLLIEYQQYFINKKRMKRTTLIDVIIGGPNEEHCNILLCDEESRRVISMVITTEEGAAIVRCLKKIDMPRPMTFDLMGNIMKGYHLEPEGAYINGLSDGIFLATLKIRNNTILKEFDARPSDAITLALMFNAPVYIAQEIIDRVGFPVPEKYKNLSSKERGIEILTKKIADNKKQIKTFTAKAAAQSKTQDVQAKFDDMMEFVFGH